MSEVERDELTSSRDPKHATITVRIIKSFEYRTIKNHVFRDVDLTTTTARDLLRMVEAVVATDGRFRPYRTVPLNTLKIYTHAHMSKTMNLAINLDHDDWILHDLDKPLSEYGIMNETELSCFDLNLYKSWQANPVENWQ